MPDLQQASGLARGSSLPRERREDKWLLPLDDGNHLSSLRSQKKSARGTEQSRKKEAEDPSALLLDNQAQLAPENLLKEISLIVRVLQFQIEISQAAHLQSQSPDLFTTLLFKSKEV